MKKTIVGIIAGLIAGLVIGRYALGPSPEANPAPAASTAKSEKKILYYRNPMNPTVTSPVPMKDEMGMDYVPVYSSTTKAGAPPSPNAVFINPAFVQNMGVVTADVEKRQLARVIRTSGAIDFDERKVYSVNAKIMGWADKLMVNYTGQQVKQGQALFDLYSPDLVSAENEYLQALKYLKQMKESGSPDSVKTAQEMAESAKKRLLFWDIPAGEIAALERRGSADKHMTIYAPESGVVVEKMVVQGQQVMPGMALYKIADLTKVWVMGSIYQSELPWVKLGQKAQVKLSYLPGQVFEGEVTYLSPTVNADTKTATVRIELENTQSFDLKPGMFATVEIKSELPEPVVAVPEQAIIRTGERALAIIALGNGYFEPREVTLGAAGDGYVEVKNGLNWGEKIVISSQFLIDSESNLKAAISSMSSGSAGVSPQPGMPPQPGATTQPAPSEHRH